jgi:rubrerythrin
MAYYDSYSYTPGYPYRPGCRNYPVSYMGEPPIISPEPPYPYPPHHKPYPPKPEPYPPVPLPTPVCPEVANDYYTYPQNLVPALELIEKAVADERHDELFYDYMIKLAPTKEDKDIIAGIRDDERKHSNLFRHIYCELTGQTLPASEDGEFRKPKTYCEGIQEAFMGELAAVEMYRRILYAMQNRRHINMLVEIITDEQKHAAKWDHLYAMNECFEECREERKKKIK